jgi:hypothetical protein
MPHRIFTIADQIAFAELSGDNNPVLIRWWRGERCLAKRLFTGFMR